MKEVREKVSGLKDVGEKKRKRKKVGEECKNVEEEENGCQSKYVRGRRFLLVHARAGTAFELFQHFLFVIPKGEKRRTDIKFGGMAKREMIKKRG